MKKISISRILLLVLALLLIGVGALGAFAVTSSGLPFESDDYKATFYMNHLQVHLIENDNDVCGGNNTLDGPHKVTGALATSLGSSTDDNGQVTLGNVDPGRNYKEEIKVRNGKDVPVYIRMVVRKYWVDEKGEKTKESIGLSPEQICLTYSDEEDYNSSAWFRNPAEHTAESETYYYYQQLPSGSDSELLFKTLNIDKSVMPDMNKPTEDQLKSDEYKDFVTVTTDESTGATVYTYTYNYDGYAFIIKADVQAIQTHNANDAIHSQWGVTNVAESNGTLSLSKEARP